MLFLITLKEKVTIINGNWYYYTNAIFSNGTTDDKEGFKSVGCVVSKSDGPKIMKFTNVVEVAVLPHNVLSVQKINEVDIPEEFKA